MIKPYLASLSSAFALLGLFGCSPQSLGTGNPGPGEDATTRAVRDASVTDARAQIDFHGYIGGSFDAAACDCRIGADGVLRMSWDCFSTSYGNGSPELGWCGAPGQWTSACGLDVFSYDNMGLTQLFVYDKSGTEVGAQFANSSVGYVCPSDPTLTASKVAGGQSPDAACTTVVCPCNADRTFTCPAPDAGISPDAGIRDAAPLERDGGTFTCGDAACNSSEVCLFPPCSCIVLGDAGSVCPPPHCVAPTPANPLPCTRLNDGGLSGLITSPDGDSRICYELCV